MSDLAAFLTARLAEDEAAAKRAAKKRPGLWRVLGEKLRSIVVGTNRDLVVADGPGEVAEHIARWDPARVLREVEAKRKILERHGPHETAFDGLACNWCSEDVDDRPQLAKEPWPCGDVRAIAAIWADHPGYQQEWA